VNETQYIPIISLIPTSTMIYPGLEPAISRLQVCMF